MGFRVDVLAALEFPPKRPPMVSGNKERSSPHTPDAGVDHNNTRGWRIIDDGLIKLYGMRRRRGWFETDFLGVVILSSWACGCFMNKKILAHNELWGIPYGLGY
jgi:hypothetical protein